MHTTVDPPHRADYFRMAGMPNQDDLTTLICVALAFHMHLRDQRAGGVDNGEPAVGREVLDHARNSVRAEYRDAALRDLVDLIHKTCTFGAQALDDVAIVNDFMTDIDRRSILLERTLDNLDRAFNSCTETARLS